MVCCPLHDSECLHDSLHDSTWHGTVRKGFTWDIHAVNNQCFDHADLKQPVRAWTNGALKMKLSWVARVIAKILCVQSKLKIS